MVLWQFAVRELTSGDWPLIRLPAAGDQPTPTGIRDPVEPVRFRGTVLATSGVPTPGTVPYRNAILSLHVVDADGHQRVHQPPVVEQDQRARDDHGDRAERVGHVVQEGRTDVAQRRQAGLVPCPHGGLHRGRDRLEEGHDSIPACVSLETTGVDGERIAAGVAED